MKKIYLLFLLLTTIVSCQKDEINNKNSELPDQKVRLTSIDFKDLPYFILNSVEDYSKVNEAQISNIFGEINRKIPVKKISMPSGAVSYTFILNNFQQKKNEEESYHFDNLIIKQSKKQSLQIYIVRYTPAQEWLNNGHNFGNYIGQISIYNGNGLFISTESYPQNQETSDTNKTECALEFDRAEWSCSGIEGSMDPGDCHWIYYYDLHCTGGGGTSTDGTSNDPNPNEPGGFSSEPSEPGGGGTSTPPLPKVSLAIEINSNNLAPCLKTIMDSIQGHYHGVGKILAQFNDNTLQNYNWTVNSGVIGGSAIGQTASAYDTVNNIATTTFDSSTFNNASDLSWVKTILHESVHAYVLSVTYDESLTQAEKNALLGPNYLSAYINSGHTFIATQYLNSMADILQEYAEFKGYYPYGNDLAKNREFYEDLAWGGLKETAEWDQLSSTTKTRILNRISIEATGKDLNGIVKAQKGENAGC